MKLSVLPLRAIFMKILWNIIEGITINMMNNLSELNRVIRVCLIPNYMRARGKTFNAVRIEMSLLRWYPDTHIEIPSTAFLKPLSTIPIRVFRSFTTNLCSYLNRHPSWSFIRTGTATIYRWSVIGSWRPYSGKVSSTNRADMIRFHSFIIPFKFSPCKGLEVIL